MTPIAKGCDVAVLAMEAVSVSYGGRRAPTVVQDVSVTLDPGETLGVVGESGSGKTTLGLAALGLLPITSGSVRIDGREIAGLSGSALRKARARASMIFQSSSASLDPRRTVGWSITEPLLARGRGLSARQDAARLLLADVGLKPEMEQRYPHQLSGGQKQRVGIARALAASPAVLVCDEPTSALDVSVQAQIVNLLLRLQAERGLAMMFITHDLAVVEAVSHRIAVMRDGRLVEAGAAAQVLRAPQSDYTRRLLAAVPGGTKSMEGDEA